MKMKMMIAAAIGLTLAACRPETPKFLAEPGAETASRIDTVLVPTRYQVDLSGIDSLLR